MTTGSSRPRAISLWWQAIRPKTLVMAVSPVIIGTALAWTSPTPVVYIEVPIMILMCAIAIQAGTNLFNDAQDFVNGTDSANGTERLGPPRITALGWALPHQVSTAALIAFLIAMLGGLYLVAIGGWPIYILGIVSLGAGALYSRGPYPISHSPFGEAVVIAFFGVAAVVGTYYLQTGSVSASAWLWGVIMGFPAGAVLLLNNVRDAKGDQRAGRRTLAIRLGLTASRHLYTALMVAPFALVIFGVASHTTSPGALAALATVPLAIRAVRTSYVTPPSPELNLLLGATVRFQGLFALSTALGLVLLPF